MKKTIFGTILKWGAMAITISIWINLIRQWGNLAKASRQVAENEAEIARLIEENRMWEEKVAISTSSAYLEQEARDKLGLGGVNDYWLLLPPEDKNLDLYPEYNEVRKEAVWRQWWGLFTK